MSYMKTYVATVSIKNTNKYLYHFTLEAENAEAAMARSSARIAAHEAITDVRLTGAEGDEGYDEEHDGE